MIRLADLWAPSKGTPLPAFTPTARYFAAMDCLIYLREECSYRAVRLNSFTTVLLHPQEDRPVGVKLKGMHFLHEKLKAILAGAGMLQSQLSGIGLISYWELALTNSSAEKERQRLLAARAKTLVQDAGAVSADEFSEAA